MCVEIHTTYTKCTASFTHTVLCSDFLNNNVDDEETPCYLCRNFTRKQVNCEGGGCTCRIQRLRVRCSFAHRDGEKTLSMVEVVDLGVNARLARQYGEWKEQTRVRSEADEYRRFLEGADVRVEDIAAEKTMESGLTDYEGDIDGMLDKMPPPSRERGLLRGKEREGGKDEIIQESVEAAEAVPRELWSPQQWDLHLMKLEQIEMERKSTPKKRRVLLRKWEDKATALQEGGDPRTHTQILVEIIEGHQSWVSNHIERITLRREKREEKKRELKRQAVEDADTEYKPEYEPRKRFRGRGEVV